MSLASTLWHLQAISQELDDNKTRLSLVQEALTDDPAVTAAHLALESAQKQLVSMRAIFRERELESSGLDMKIKNIEERLYSGSVTNPKELGGLEKDLQIHKRRRSDQDDDMLRLMDSIEQSQALLDEKTHTLEQLETTRAGNIEHLTLEYELLTNRINELSAEREQTRQVLGADVLHSYDQLERSKMGRAVAQLHREACSVCGVSTPTGLIQRVRIGDEMILCPGCGRILTA